ncbi:MAG: hypothetical protein RLZZ387_4584 [Chloroflexota bacterium]|jgi:hypothetical protein
MGSRWSSSTSQGHSVDKDKEKRGDGMGLQRVNLPRVQR